MCCINHVITASMYATAWDVGEKASSLLLSQLTQFDVD